MYLGSGVLNELLMYRADVQSGGSNANVPELERG